MFGNTTPCKLPNTNDLIIHVIIEVGFQPAWGDRLSYSSGRSWSGGGARGGGARTLVAVNSVLALHARLAGCPTEALAALAHARAVYSVQADPVPKADVFRPPWAGLALGAKEARTTLSRLKGKDEAGGLHVHLPLLFS